MSKPEAVICAPVRTAIGTYNGSLKTTPATELGAAAIRQTLRRTCLGTVKIDGVVMGNVIQAGNKMNPARQAAIHAGLPVDAPAMTVNRVCGSGAQAIATAAQEIWLGLYSKCNGRGRDGEYGHGAISHERRTLGLPDGRRPDP